MIGNKKRLGFILNILGGISWISNSLITSSAFGLLIVCSAAIALNVKGFINWKEILEKSNG